MPSNATAKIKSALKRREVLLLLLTALVLAGIFWAYGFRSNPVLQAGGQKYGLEVAKTPDEQRQGLSGRASMPRHRGMLFIFPKEGRQCFWMKDMRFSLDIIWVDSQKKVKHIARDVSPDTYPDAFCHEAARYVIELGAGEAAKAGLHKGQTLQF
jgi:uncharacterized protein